MIRNTILFKKSRSFEKLFSNYKIDYTWKMYQKDSMMPRVNKRLEKKIAGQSARGKYFSDIQSKMHLLYSYERVSRRTKQEIKKFYIETSESEEEELQSRSRGSRSKRKLRDKFDKKSRLSIFSQNSVGRMKISLRKSVNNLKGIKMLIDMSDKKSRPSLKRLNGSPQTGKHQKKKKKIKRYLSKQVKRSKQLKKSKFEIHVLDANEVSNKANGYNIVSSKTNFLDPSPLRRNSGWKTPQHSRTKKETFSQFFDRQTSKKPEKNSSKFVSLTSPKSFKREQKKPASVTELPGSRKKRKKRRFRKFQKSKGNSSSTPHTAYSTLKFNRTTNTTFYRPKRRASSVYQQSFYETKSIKFEEKFTDRFLRQFGDQPKLLKSVYCKGPRLFKKIKRKKLISNG